MKTTTTTALPVIQKEFMKTFDGSLESIISFPQLNYVLNPTFTSHFFYVSGESDVDMVTTKHTDGSFAFWGKQTDEEMTNAQILADELKELILSFNPVKLENLLDFDVDKMRAFGSKVSRVRARAAFIIDGEIRLVSGLQL